MEVELKDVAAFTYGYTDTAKESGDTRFIRITDINDNGHLKNEPKYITLKEEAKNYLLNEGDLLMARTGATYGKTLYYDNCEQSVYASFLIKIALDNHLVLNKYYWHFAQSEAYWQQANTLVTSGGQPQFNANALGRVKMKIPTIERQKRVCELLDEFDRLSNDMESGIPAEIDARQKQYEYYRDKLLTFKEKE